MEKAVVSITLSTLGDLLLEEGRFLYGVSGEVKALQTLLKEMICFLEDADRRRHESKSVVNWISEIKDLAHRAQDAIETYAVEVSSKKKKGRGLRHLVCRFPCFLNKGIKLHQIGSEISEIKFELSRVGKSMQEYGLRSIINEGESSTSEINNQKWKRLTFPHETEDCFVGKGEEVEQLVSLTVDNKEHRVVSIWGMGGIGKTSIARKVYNDVRTKRSFDSFAWVCITQQCWVRSVLEDVLKQLSQQNGDVSGLSDTQLIGQLCEIQRGKRCMIVLDDIWEIDHWNALKHACLVQGSKGKTMVTTRKKGVAERVGLAFEIGLLTIDDGLELLKKKAFPHTNGPDLDQIVTKGRWRRRHRRPADVAPSQNSRDSSEAQSSSSTNNGKSQNNNFSMPSSSESASARENQTENEEKTRKFEVPKENQTRSKEIQDFTFEEKWLSNIGKGMVRKCGCLPLAISLLGGILSGKKLVKEWELVNENISKYVYRGGNIDKENEIQGVLSLSYEDLPYYLKPCFLYMGLFRENEIVHATSVYKVWIAQGMISPEHQGEGETLMDVAEIYLSELASRCIVQVEVNDVTTSRQKYGLCKLHDIVRELCLSLGRNELGLRVLNYQGGGFITLLHESLSVVKTRHLAIHFGRETEPERDDDEFNAHEESKHVRSLHFINYTKGKAIELRHKMVDLRIFKLLRVLVFMGIKFERRELPGGIGNLIHLRYLHLQGCEFDELPSSISNLAYLYTLDLQYSWNVRVPGVLMKLRRLKHLILPFYNDDQIGDYRLKLDEGLDELETLMWLDSAVHDLKSITRMKNLRSLSATVRDNESLSSIIDAITANSENLHYCAIIITAGCQCTSGDEGLMNFKKVLLCPGLTTLGTHFAFGKLLKECENQIFSSKLVILALVESEMEDDPMEILGKLPCLDDLCLSLRSFIGDEMKCDAFSFRRLKKLMIAGLPNLREWRVEKGAMPNLSEMKIQYCPRLEMVPDGLRFITTLQKLTISDMPDLGERVSHEGGEDFYKVQHVPFIIID